MGRSGDGGGKRGEIGECRCGEEAAEVGFLAGWRWAWGSCSCSCDEGYEGPAIEPPSLPLSPLKPVSTPISPPISTIKLISPLPDCHFLCRRTRRNLPLLLRPPPLYHSDLPDFLKPNEFKHAHESAVLLLEMVCSFIVE